MTSAELQLDRDGSPVATSSATYVKVDADVEADWRARYLRESDTEATEVRVDPRNAIETSGECNRTDPPFDNPFAPDADE